MKPILPLALLSLFPLSACDQTEQLIAFNVENYAVLFPAARGSTTATTMPTNGGADYVGYANMEVSDPVARASDHYAGRSTFSAEFTSSGGTVEGTLDNFVVRRAVPWTEADVAYLAFDAATTDAEREAARRSLLEGAVIAEGAVAIPSTTITGRDFTATFDGTVSEGGSSLNVAGTGVGRFWGTDADGVSVLGRTATTGLLLTQDGTARGGAVEAVGRAD
ncbi:MAG: hypothetical protein VX874_05380 [Pseudomonadota bacterium]|nr:hypothetical protein [Pseudomonadota bacterium]